MLCGRGLDSSGDVLVYTRNLASLARDMGVDIRWRYSVVVKLRQKENIKLKVLTSIEVSSERRVQVRLPGVSAGALPRHGPGHQPRAGGGGEAGGGGGGGRHPRGGGAEPRAGAPGGRDLVTRGRSVTLASCRWGSTSPSTR